MEHDPLSYRNDAVLCLGKRRELSKHGIISVRHGDGLGLVVGATAGVGV